jgi:intein-encoded DNA endonuclease-like protein
LEPSEDLAYIIGVVLGDGSVYITFKIRRTTRVVRYRIALEAKDKELIEKFARCLCIVLGRKRIKVRYERSKGTYHVDAGSKALYELLKEPDLERLRKHIEHCDKCVAAFLRGFVDSEASVKKDGYILISNTNYELTTYIQNFLRGLV